MSFLNPLMLAGVSAGLVPLVLHLLNRSRYRNVDWAAMMFLEGLDARQHRSTRLKQWILLGTRMLILGLLAVALARPVFYARGAPTAQAGRTAAAILLDRSGSMSLNDNGRVRLDLAREATFQLLSPGFRRGDDLWLLPLGERDPAAPPRYAGDPQEMALRVKEVNTASGEADVAAGLREALEVLSKAKAPNREIYVICDRQAGSWRGVDEKFVIQWRERLAANNLKQAPRLLVVPVGTEETDNVAIESIELLRQPFVAEQLAEVLIKVRNFGSVPRAAVPLTVEARMPAGNRIPIRQMALNLPAGALASTVVPVTFSEEGPKVILARVTAAGLATDKEMGFAVDVLHEIKVLIVDGDEREGMFQSGSDFLKAALTPYSNLKRNTASVTVVRPEMWTPLDLHDYQVVILTNVPMFTEAQAQALEQFVHDGGGLIVAPGDQSRLDIYNSFFSWLPGTLQPATPESESGATALAAFESSHPIFRFLKGRADPAPGAAVRRYFPVQPREGGSILASFADGKPFLLESAVGRGRVLLMTTPVDTEWNALPMTNFFLPFVQSAVRYAACGRTTLWIQQRNVNSGEPLLAEFDEPLDARSISVDVPGGKFDPAALAVSQFGASTQVRYGDTHVPGVYRIRRTDPKSALADSKTALFAVHTSGQESDLTPLSAERWRWLERELGFEMIDPDRQPIATSQEAIRSGWDLWIGLLGCVLVLSVLELSATRRWAGRGT